MGEVAGVFVALFAAHQIADHWGQLQWMADRKGLPGWPGRWACAAHVATYSVFCLVALVALFVSTGWWPNGWALLGGMAVNSGTHYFADRRLPLRRLAELTGSGDLWKLGAPRPGRDDNPSLGTGAYALDQSWHYGWLFVAALVIAA
jgi:hypothetical protein